MPNLTITNAKGEIKIVRNWLHAFGALHPFSLATGALIIGLVVGLIL